MVKEFKANNPAGVDDIPSDIYENVNVVANGSSTHWTINIKPNNTTTKYKGSKTIELKVKVGIGSFTWIEQGNYYKTMLREQIIAEFIINNPTTSGDIPSDIYDAININAIQGTNGWEIILSTKTSSPIYGGSLSFYVYTTAQPVNTIDWSPYGTYIATMTDESMTAEFINNNPAGSNGIPADIYDHVEVNAVGEGVNRIIEVHPKSGDLLYRDNCKVSVIMMGILVCGNKQYILTIFN
ncbi:MAG: hypothetical protein HUJ52_04365 [Malacoplasma sp.]|nr:hypothetical protein [Malacoplasma sp.]